MAARLTVLEGHVKLLEAQVSVLEEGLLQTSLLLVAAAH